MQQKQHTTPVCVPILTQLLVTELHTKLAEAHASQQTAQEALHAAELSLHKEVATRGVLEGTLERAHRELAEANQER